MKTPEFPYRIIPRALDDINPLPSKRALWNGLPTQPDLILDSVHRKLKTYLIVRAPAPSDCCL